MRLYSVGVRYFFYAHLCFFVHFLSANSLYAVQKMPNVGDVVGKDCIESLALFTNQSEDLLKRLGSHPILTEKVQQSLIAIAQRHTDKAERIKAGNILVRHYIRHVVSIAKQYRNRSLPQEDLVSEGTLGLWKAIEKYEDNRGTKFSTYAEMHIRNGIRQALDEVNLIHIPKYLLEARVNQGQTTDKGQSRNNLSSNTNEKDSSQNGGPVPTKEKKVDGMLLRSAERALKVSRDSELAPKQAKAKNSVLDNTPGKEDGPETWLRKQETTVRLKKALKALRVKIPEAAYVVERYFELRPKYWGQRNKLEDIAKTMFHPLTGKRITKERVRQRKIEGINFLKKHLPENFLEVWVSDPD